MSLKSISEMTGLSVATVSHVLNGTRAVSSESRAKVLEATKKIGYRPNLAGRMLRTQKSNTLALVIPGVEPKRSSNYFFMDVISGVRHKLIEADFDLIVSTYGEPRGEKELKALQVIGRQWVDGILLVPESRSNEHIEQINQFNIPCVMIDRRIDSDHFSSVDSDNEGGAYAAVKLLADSGKTRIAFVGGRMLTSSGAGRFTGYKKALNELNLAYDERLVISNDRFSIENGMSSGQKLLDQKVDGIFVADNLLTMGVLKQIQLAKVRIPEEVGLVGYDDYDWMEVVTPPLSTVKQQAFQMGYLAAELLLRKLNGFAGNERVILNSKLVIRESHGTYRPQEP